MYIDAHTHLNDPGLFLDRQDHLKHFIDKGGVWIINVWADTTFNQNAIHITQQRTKQSKCLVKAALWFHPYEVVINVISQENIATHIQDLKQQIQKNPDHVVAVGEAGIDLHYEWAQDTLELQKKLFDEQCKLAEELHFPLIIHSRDAFDETFDILKNYKKLKIYFHCRGYNPEQIQQLQDYFPHLRIWFCGNTTYKKAENLRDSLKATDINKLLLETDAPYLSPQAVRGQRNQPAHITHLYDYVAELLGISLQDLQTTVKKNFESLYFE